MNKTLNFDLDAERAKLTALETAVGKQKARIEAYLQLTQQPDVLDDLLGKQRSSGAIPASAPSVETNADTKNTQRRARRGENTDAVISVLGENEIHLSEILRLLNDKHGIQMPQASLRTLLWTLKSKGLTHSSKAGFHALTSKGMQKKLI